MGQGSQIFPRVEDEMEELGDSLPEEFLVLLDVDDELDQGFEEHFVDVELGDSDRVDLTGNFGTHFAKLTITSHLGNVCELQVDLVIVLRRFHVADVIEIFVELLEEGGEEVDLSCLQQTTVRCRQLQRLELLAFDHLGDHLHTRQVLEIETSDGMFRS